MVAIDFFCGAGGVTKGLTNAGIKVIAGIDKSGEFKETFVKNNPRTLFIENDIKDISVSDIKKLLLKNKKNYTMFAGCAPCQPFSGHYKGNADGRSDKRKYASKFFANIIEEIQPDFVVSENVPGIKKKYNGKVLSDFVNTLEDNGYGVAKGVVDAKWYGVPQTRRRMIILASTIGNIKLPPKTHGPGLEPYKTVRDAISKYPGLNAGKQNVTIPNHRAAGLSDLNLKRMKATPKDGGSRKDWPKELWLKCHKKKNCGHTDVYGRMRWDAPAPTLTCRSYSISNGRFGHPSQNRAISFREAAALQTFPDDYIFYGISYYSIAMQIGNAVPVLLAEVIGKQFKKIVKGR